jgi:aryl-alcohol dehydrogenase-like predicted oxidoreductase
VVAALTDLRCEGLIGGIAIAGNLDTWKAAKAANIPATLLQIENSPFNRNLATARMLPPTAKPVTTITHSVFGVAGALAELCSQFRSQPKLRQKLLALRYTNEESLPRLLLDYAFASNPTGIVLVSAFSREHLQECAASACREPDLQLKRNLDELV